MERKNKMDNDLTCQDIFVVFREVTSSKSWLTNNDAWLYTNEIYDSFLFTKQNKNILDYTKRYIVEDEIYYCFSETHKKNEVSYSEGLSGLLTCLRNCTPQYRIVCEEEKMCADSTQDIIHFKFYKKDKE